MGANTADVIVVGLGAFGSATVYQLARQGVKVIGIDQYAPPHDRGASHGSTRITRLAVGEGEVYIPIIKRSHEIWNELEASTGQKLYYKTGGLIMGPQDGTISHHGKPDFVRRTIANAERWGIDHEVLDAVEVSARYPQFQTRGDELAYLEPDSGVLVPEACVQAQLQQALALGAELRLNEKVLYISEEGANVKVRTSLGAYSAAKVVVTAGPWLPAMTGGTMQMNLRVLRQALHWFETTRPSLYSPDVCPIFIWMHGSRDQDYMYGFPMVDGKPGVKVASEQYETECTPDDFDRVVGAEESQEMFDINVAGRLAGVTSKTVHSAACLYTVSSDSGFVVDTYRDMENVMAVSACSGHGFKNSAGLGERMARWATTREPAGLEHFRVARFNT
ncbi:N-methyl-L-tryptophan oxidase [Paraburkholderia silvatlantica]|uniref:N-methyl-L-tryptophan oxidase n=1 Tax=Paraburkholderia silvatlantica TaxID=321895 RepID=UPI00105F8429|nr:N-methyl-L-tryptophan oxidase [Paraburkholderia silvatlantica]TDQ89379.1 monomeric sarcosine oxidase [Paraburkholderia silvatlantica]